ncbi:MAG: hypothetical protein P8L20_11485, partial [Flavobacteriales bacterium]|nr:hypothetical protein [Flavobacteriales bacterium]
MLAQAPDGFPSTFIAGGNGNWNTVTWNEIPGGTDPDGPDGDDTLIINSNSITVTADADFGRLEYNAAGTTQPTLTVNSGVILTGGAIIVTASQNGLPIILGVPTPKDQTFNIDGGTVSCTELDLTTTRSTANVRFNIQNGGTLTIENDITMVSNTSDTDILLDAGTTGTGNTLNLGGAIIGLITSDGIIDMGSSTGVSTFNYNGGAAQIIEFDSPTDLRYADLQVSNSSEATLETGLSSTNVTGNVTISAGGVFNDGGNTSSFTGEITNEGTYNSVGSGALTLTGNLTNSVGGVFNDGGLGTVVNGDVANAGTYNGQSGSLDISGDFTNSGTFTSSGFNINLAGNWNNTGTYTFFSGDNVIFDGAGTSTITGATDWYELTADKAIGVSVSSGAQNIHGILDLNQGTFTSGGLVTLISDATSTGQMDDIGTATFSGNLTVQRRIAKTGQSWSSITSPVEGTTLATWQGNGVLFSGFPTSDFPTFPFVNCFEYDEPSHGSDKDDGWDEANGMTDATGPDNNYRAHYVYMDAATFNLSVTGAPITGAETLPLDFNSSGNATQDGWNLVGNPYPCSIDFDEIYSSNSGNIIDGYLVYSGEFGNYGWYDGATTGTGVGSGGATKDIPHSQGIWLQS